MLWLTSTIRSVWLKTENFCLELSRSRDLCKNHRFYWGRKSRGPERMRTPRSSPLGSPAARRLAHPPSSCAFKQKLHGRDFPAVPWLRLRVPRAGGPGLIPARRASLGAQRVKNPPADAGDPGWIPGLGRSPGEGRGNPLPGACRENPMDREAWQATAHGVVKSQAWLRG